MQGEDLDFWSSTVDVVLKDPKQLILTQNLSYIFCSQSSSTPINNPPKV